MFFKYASTLIMYTTEIVRTIPTWMNFGQLTIEGLNRYIKMLLQLTRMLVPSTILNTLCFEIINLLGYDFMGEFLLTLNIYSLIYIVTHYFTLLLIYYYLYN